MDIERLFLPPSADLKSAIATIETEVAKIVLVVDESKRLLGTVTDGDIRRGLLRGIDLTAAVSEVMNPHPTTVGVEEEHARVFEIMQRAELRQIPRVAPDGRIVALVRIDEYLHPDPLDHLAVIMAGGEGRRLRPLTDTIPKPMLPVGGRPILETIVDRLARQGLNRLLISVNYRADIIMRHFGDGRSRGVDIRYLRESRPLGTAGALGLLPERPTRPLLVTNGDVLTKLDYRDLLHYHARSKAAVTMCVQQYTYTVPFGVVSLDHDRIVSIQEKPTFEHFVNSGIYVLQPEVLDLLPRTGERCDMPDLLGRVLAEGGGVGAFPIREYWMDVGHPDDLDRAHREFDRIFGE